MTFIVQRVLEVILVFLFLALLRSDNHPAICSVIAVSVILHCAQECVIVSATSVSHSLDPLVLSICRVNIIKEK